MVPLGTLQSRPSAAGGGGPRTLDQLFPRLRRRGGRVVDPAGWHAGRRAADDAELGTGRRPLTDGTGQLS